MAFKAIALSEKIHQVVSEYARQSVYHEKIKFRFFDVFGGAFHIFSDTESENKKGQKSLVAFAVMLAERYSEVFQLQFEQATIEPSISIRIFTDEHNKAAFDKIYKVLLRTGKKRYPKREWEESRGRRQGLYSYEIPDFIFKQCLEYFQSATREQQEKFFAWRKTFPNDSYFKLYKNVK